MIVLRAPDPAPVTPARARTGTLVLEGVDIHRAPELARLIVDAAAAAGIPVRVAVPAVL
jgi:hypothetical protein